MNKFYLVEFNPLATESLSYDFFVFEVGSLFFNDVL